VEQHARPVVAVCAGVGRDIQRQPGQRPVAGCAERHRDRHRVPGGRRRELLLAGQLELDRPSGAQHCQRDDVLGQHLLLAAEAAPDPLRDDPHLVLGQAEDPADLVPGEERHLGRRPQHQSSGPA
jgi:hypothetical protein